ncbi:amino acid permease/ SLC12A domain-containing protein [Coprinopsis sp. MPI-PUGE-AT-0042]|nr:amino acid permease/ SLC12A domain-containing protein [Coprinopsis sp. MPI-PUGE-AT-0042]
MAKNDIQDSRSSSDGLSRTSDPGLADEKGLYKEKDGANVTVVGADSQSIDGSLQRNLKGRHLSMIALGGTIGTGLFVGSGNALATAGPVGAWLAYIIMGSIVYCMMVALGEMATQYPVAGGLTLYATRFVDPAMGFALGWNYFYSWAITIPTELTASAIVIGYWNDTINPGVWITILFVAILVINFLGVGIYGEAEFIFSTMKIMAIVALIILGIILDAGGGPNKDPIGFRYWRNPGPFNSQTINGGDDTIPGDWGKFLAFWNVFVQAAFSFLGTEIVAVTASEAKNPRRNVPKAIKQVFFRILAFYVLGIWVISVLVPYDDPTLLGNLGEDTASASPFVIAIDRAGIRGLGSVINAVILIAAWSAGNSDMYAASRTLHALALEGKAPAIVRKCTKNGLPYVALIITGLFGFLAYLNVKEGANVEVFNWLFNVSSITGLIAWSVILGAYLRFYYGMKKQGLDRNLLPYKAPFQPYLSWFGFIFVNLVILFNGYTVFLTGNWDISTFFAAYISLPIFAVCYVGWKWTKKTKWVRLDEIDFHSDLRELDEMDRREKEKDTTENGWWNKFCSTLF